MGVYDDKYLDAVGVKFLWDTAENTYIKKEPGKSLSDNNYTTAEKNKLANLENYTLPKASVDALGGIKIGSGLIIDSNGVVSTIIDPEIDFSDIENLPTTLEGYGILDAATKDELDELRQTVTRPYTYKGKVPTVADLDNVQNPQNGDIYGVEENGMNYAWNEAESRWDNIGSLIIIQSLSNQDIDNICQ